MRHSSYLSAGILAGGIAITSLVYAAGEPIEVLKTSGCGCCIGWVKHLEGSGYLVTSRDLPMGELMQVKLRAGLTPNLTSCHTGLIEGYVIEGHVPAREIGRLLDERPDAIGLSVPNMPMGSPGMDFGEAEPYQVLLVRRDEGAVTYASYR